MSRRERSNLALFAMIFWSVFITPITLDLLFSGLGPFPWRPWQVSALSLVGTFPLWFFGLGGLWWSERATQ